MAVIGIGTDIIEISRVKKAAEKRFLARFFSENENALFMRGCMRYETIAGNFAAKEAFVKALGTGFKGIEPKDIEVLREKNGKPYIILCKTAKAAADELCVTNIFVTIAHLKEYATATVVLERL